MRKRKGRGTTEKRSTTPYTGAAAAFKSAGSWEQKMSTDMMGRKEIKSAMKGIQSEAALMATGGIEIGSGTTERYMASEPEGGFSDTGGAVVE